jgi:hypothetical protein
MTCRQYDARDQIGSRPGPPIAANCGDTRNPLTQPRRMGHAVSYPDRGERRW